MNARTVNIFQVGLVLLAVVLFSGMLFHGAKGLLLWNK